MTDNDIEEINEFIKELQLSIESDKKEASDWSNLFESDENIIANHLIYSKNNPFRKSPTIYYSDILNSLSKTMKFALKDLVIKNSPIQTATIKALEKRNLFQNQNLTIDGKIIAVSLLSLKEQCRILQIEYKEVQCINYGRPESLIIEHYQNQNFNGVFTESRLVIGILKTVLLSVLYPKASKIFNIEDSFRLQFLGYPILHSIFSNETYKEITNAFKNIESEEFFYYFNLNKTIETQTIFCTGNFTLSGTGDTGYIDFDPDSAYKIFKLLGSEKLIEIFKKINRNMILYAGWPDLIVFNIDSYSFIEVKKNDKLLPTQIATFIELISLGMNIKVNRCVQI